MLATSRLSRSAVPRAVYPVLEANAKRSGVLTVTGSVDAVEGRHNISCAVDWGTPQEQDMNAPSNIVPVAADSDGDVVHWLMNGTRDERFVDNIFAELCIRI